ncbi:methyl-accepting chemotaxis protein [Butyrivibrio sp. VCB2006]|uniref:methyl-accepting chemotaxis protein n=1 Tax=Butyrivibrio sp. VCB2006 TaxID=1280679 RepID=UPI000403D516|nr:methyl-accepting chemotaxis protein [Butyrivibrio sp. VCB2006]
MAEKTNGKTAKVKNEIGFFDSIKTKLILVMLLVTAIPLLTAVIVSYVSSTNKAMADAQESLEWEAQYIESLFVNILDANMNMCLAIAGNPTVINYVKGEGNIPYDAVQATILECDAVLADGENTSIAGSDGMQVARGTGDFINVGEREYFQKAMQGSTYVSNVTISKTNGRRMITFAVPIKDNGNIIGIVHRNYDLNNFHDLLASKSDDAFIVDREGLVAAHSQYEIGEGAHDEESRATSEFMVSGKDQGFYFVDTGKGYNAYVAYYKEPKTGFCVCTATTDTVILSAARKSATLVVVVGVVMLIAAAVISFMMAKSFADPIAALKDSFEALADGRFKTVDKKYGVRKDEFGLISKATNSVIGTLNDIVSNIKRSASEVGSSSEELSDMANQISQTAEDVSNAVQEIASGATQQADEIQSASENVGRIGDAVLNVQNSTDDLSGIAQKMKEASEISSNSLASLQDSSAEMTAKIDDISRTIGATQDAVNNISEKVEGITSIATQTNLLSLNASIEAARAGEAGKGFAVVAEEIGKLAEDSKAMADDIKREMESLLEQSKAAVAAAEDVKQGNNDQQIALGETLDAVNGMLSDIGSTVGGVRLISEGAETCDSSKNAVVDTMSALSAISEENAASSEETGASMQELSATVTSLAGSANSLKEIAEKLNEEMKFFKDNDEE